MVYAERHRSYLRAAGTDERAVVHYYRGGEWELCARKHNHASSGDGDFGVDGHGDGVCERDRAAGSDDRVDSGFDRVC